MGKALFHPERARIDLSAVLDALSDPVRREIAARLARKGEDICSAFEDCASRTNLTYHVGRLREAGVIRVRMEGAFRHLSLRVEDLEARFPGLLPAILEGTRREALLPPPPA